MKLSLAWVDGFPRLYDRASGKYLENREEVTARADAEKARADAAETQRDALAAHLCMTEMQLESEIKARAAEREASEAEIRRLQDLVSQLQNPRSD